MRPMICNVLAGIAVRDTGAARQWYAALLGRAPDATPMAGLLEWRFDGGAWLQLFTDAARAGQSSATFVENDIAGRVAALENAGIPIKSRSAGTGVAVVIIDDPDGNQLVFAHGSDETHRSTRPR